MPHSATPRSPPRRRGARGSVDRGDEPAPKLDSNRAIHASRRGRALGVVGHVASLRRLLWPPNALSLRFQESVHCPATSLPSSRPDQRPPAPISPAGTRPKAGLMLRWRRVRSPACHRKLGAPNRRGRSSAEAERLMTRSASSWNSRRGRYRARRPGASGRRRSRVARTPETGPVPSNAWGPKAREPDPLLPALRTSLCDRAYCPVAAVGIDDFAPGGPRGARVHRGVPAADHDDILPAASSAPLSKSATASPKPLRFEAIR